MEQEIIPQMDLLHLKSSLLSIVIYELTFMTITCSGPDMAAVLPTLAPSFKHEFVHANHVDIQKRVLLCCYDPEV